MRHFILPLLLIYFSPISSQNLPSLLSGKNLNATFSIVAFDSTAQEWGIAVATNNIYVGNSTVYIEPGLGAFSVIAETAPEYALNGFDQLKNGATIRSAIEYTMQKDADVCLRQVSGIDRFGNTFAFTGSAWKYQKGFAGSLVRNGYVVMGNQLADSVLSAMSSAFAIEKGPLAKRLLAALLAGQAAGGQVPGKQSAALVVKGTRNEWFNNIDLRVDDSGNPFADLQRLLNYHYGRIQLTRAINAIKTGDLQRGKALLADAQLLTKGWNGLMGKIAVAYLLLHQQPEAVAIIHDALRENPQWKENLPFFYILKDDPAMRSLIDVSHFTEKDWIAAVDLPGQLMLDSLSETLARKALRSFPNSSYLHYQFAQALHARRKDPEAKVELKTAILLDPTNAEATQMQTTL
jgi:uncharacterized Ntn-hydrolase superfamily protein